MFFLRADGTRYFCIGERSVVMAPVGLRALWSLGLFGFTLIYIAFFLSWYLMLWGAQ